MNLKSKIFIESINKSKLICIINNFDSIYTKLFSKENDNEKKEQILTNLKKYLSRVSDNGQIYISYDYPKKNKGKELTGRLICSKGVGLQLMKKIIKNTIIEDRYIDIDIVRCHPQLLLNLYNIHGIPSMFLTLYLNDTDKYHEEISKACKIKKNEAKILINTLIYGGRYQYENMVGKPNFLIDLKNEIENNNLILLSKDNIFKMLKKDKLLSTSFTKNNFNKSQSRFIGSLISNLLCSIENEILHEMVYSLETITNNKKIIEESILCFDGIMIKKDYVKNFDIDKLLKNIEENIYNKLSHPIKLKVKEIGSTLDLSGYNKKNEQKEEESIYAPKYIGNKCPYIKYNNYFWFDFVRDVCNKVHISLEELKISFRENINKVFFRTIKGNFYVRKINKENYFSIENKVPTEALSYCDIVKGKETVINIEFKNLLIKLGFLKLINVYNEITLKPYDIYSDRKIRIDPRTINSFNGFKAKLIKKKYIDEIKIKPILEFLKTVWCNNDNATFLYLLSWFHHIFRHPDKKTKITIVLFSHEKQIGKGILINEFLIPYIFGKEYSMQVTGLDTITSKFNSILMNKFFINCDELSSIQTNNNFHSHFDALKSRITEPTINIEIKGGIKFPYPDFMNLIMTTNHNNTIKMEIKDARYCVLECNSIYKGNYNYFDNLLNNFNQDVANHFFSYIYHLETNIDIRNIKMTKLKKEMTLNSIPSSLKFVLKIKDYKLNNYNDGSFYWDKLLELDKIKATDLYNYYKQFCLEENEKVKSLTKFGIDIRHITEKKRFKDGYYYYLNNIKSIF